MVYTHGDPAAVRASLVRALALDLVGPGADDELASEVLPQAPSRWYLTGFLVPLGASDEQRGDETQTEEIDALDEQGGSDDALAPEPEPARRAFFPSSLGLSVLVPAETERLSVTVEWGDYVLEGKGSPEESRGESDQQDSDTPSDEGGSDDNHANRLWRRTQRRAVVEVHLPEVGERPRQASVPDSAGLYLAITARAIDEALLGGAVPAATTSVSVFLVNQRSPAADDRRDEAFCFQVGIELACSQGFVARPNLAGLSSEEWDERVADLQYRDAYEHGVGHGVATKAEVEDDGSCRRVRTTWIPTGEVERVAPEPIAGVEFSMEALAELDDGTQAQDRLGPLVARYREWIQSQSHVVISGERRKATARELLNRAQRAADRIAEGIALLADDAVLDAFRSANRAMAAAQRRRRAIETNMDPTTVDPPAWHPFQLAFILMNLRGIVDPSHPDRGEVDLLFFPTGGGKTEAYLGLAAFTLVYRRLKNPGVSSAGVSVLMRYTLRLLTLDQLARAAALICALELEREQDPDRLGEWPFEIGLWVGRAATPNRMGRKGDGDSNSARVKTIAFRNDSRKPAPIPLEECPWCGSKFGPNSFELTPNPDAPTNLKVRCINRSCDFTREHPLPILGVDEPIYRRLPCFLIATVDKFAAMPWIGQVGAFFGRVDRADDEGFYGPCGPSRGNALERPLPPPDLVIQDELHLISGPMGTMVGLYETALDALARIEMDGRNVGPKIVASTATVRRAEHQIEALFARRVVEVFPPPGPDRRNSFFARTHPLEESYARLYAGIAAQGRSLKVVLLRTYLALLGAAQKSYAAHGGKRNSDNPADPYMTLLGYFNSLRELGGSRRIVEDEVITRLTGYSKRMRIGEANGLFADRKISYDVVELTSRVPTSEVAKAKRRLAQSFHEGESVDVALATNMISVGLDIVRLGLMVVLGQPKTTAEYIQATSRVGRDPERPGLVVTLLNLHKPRDRSHYERFSAYHESFYRSIEVTGVTPFSPRALDRGLAGTLVALARLAHTSMTPPLGAETILDERSDLAFVTEVLTERAVRHAQLSPEEADALRKLVAARAEDLLDEWAQIAHDYRDEGTRLQYQDEVGGAQRLLYEFLHPALRTLPARHLKFRANRSMRDVEPDVNLWVRTLDDREIEEEQE